MNNRALGQTSPSFKNNISVFQEHQTGNLTFTDPIRAAVPHLLLIYRAANRANRALPLTVPHSNRDVNDYLYLKVICSLKK